MVEFSEFDQIWLSQPAARQYMIFFLREESFIRSEFSSVEEAEGFGLWPGRITKVQGVFTNQIKKEFRIFAVFFNFSVNYPKN